TRRAPVASPARRGSQPDVTVWPARRGAAAARRRASGGRDEQPLAGRLLDHRFSERLAYFAARRHAVDGDDLADAKRIALPAITLEVERVADFDRPARRQPTRVTDVDVEKCARVGPVDSRNRTFDLHLARRVVG